MSQLPADRGRLLVIRAYLQLQLDDVDAALARLGSAGKHGRRSLRNPELPGWRPNPAGDPPRGEGVLWWRLQVCGDGSTLLHRGDCRIAEGHQVDRVTAGLALAEGTVRVCPRCRPDLGLT